jgi:hypothetical protein
MPSAAPSRGTNRPSARAARGRPGRHASRHRCYRAARALPPDRAQAFARTSQRAGARVPSRPDDWHELAGDKPIKQVTDRGQALLDARRCERARAGFVQVATCIGCSAPIDGTPALAHQACACAGIAKNSRKRIEARSPAAATSAGSRFCAEVTCNMLLFTMQAPAERCGIAARAVHRDVSL